MNPNVYCLSCWKFMGLGDIQHLLTSSAAPDWDPLFASLVLSLLRAYTIHVAVTSQSEPLHCNLQHPHTPPRLSLLVPLVQTAGLIASDKCSWICCCPSLWTGFQRGSVLLAEASLSSARHPARTKQGKAKLFSVNAMDGTATDMRRKLNTWLMWDGHRHVRGLMSHVVY